MSMLVSCRDDPAILHSTLRTLRTGVLWHELSSEPEQQWAGHHPRFQSRVELDISYRMLTALAKDLNGRSKLVMSGCLSDTTFTTAKRDMAIRSELYVENFTCLIQLGCIEWLPEHRYEDDFPKGEDERLLPP